MFRRLQKAHLFALFLLLGSIGYLLASSPGEVVLKTDGSITGLQNNFREFLQGERFWFDQKYLANRELNELQEQPERDRQLRIKLDEASRKFQQGLEKLYRENPQLRPSVSTQADLLRERADRLDAADMKRMGDRFRQERMRDLQQILKIFDHRPS
jgi:hypothetical protein